MKCLAMFSKHMFSASSAIKEEAQTTMMVNYNQRSALSVEEGKLAAISSFFFVEIMYLSWS